MEDHADLSPLRNLGAIRKLWKSSKPKGEIRGSKDAENYSMNYEKIGICIIFNHKTFEFSKELGERSGTDVDAEQLDLLFSKLGFDVVRCNDYTYQQISAKLQEVSGERSKVYSCFVCCILSFGTDKELCAKDGQYPVQRIYEHFYADKCDSLAGRPKIFLIQACPCNVKKSLHQSTDHGGQVSFTIPTNADFLVVFSTVPGHYSLENSKNGSWFIDALCSTISEFVRDMDLLQLLTIVNYKVSMKCNSYEKEKLKVEVPCVTSTLTRDVKLPVNDSFEFKLQEKDAGAAIDTESPSSSKIGKVIIFNHKSYKSDPKDKQSRKGTERDARNLQEIFEKLNFDVDIFTDKEKKFILKTLNSAANGPNEKYSWFICCILTHGDYGTLDACDGPYKIDDVLSPFHNNWIGKPKIFFIQACQGKMVNPGFKMVENRRHSTDSEESSFNLRQTTYADSLIVSSTNSEIIFNFRHLTHPDFLIVSSTAPGYFSFRNEETGSWFVQEMFKAFSNHCKDKSFLQLLTITNRHVAIERLSYNTKNKDLHKKKQTLCLTSTLTQNIDFYYFKQNN